METLRMSGKERVRLELMGRVKRQEITLAKAAELLRMSYRQVKRVWARYRGEGHQGLVHGLRGRRSNRRQDETRQRVLELYEAKYGGFGPTLAAEYLIREDGVLVTVETLRQWLLKAGLWQRRRHRKAHRLRRPRREHAGELVQMDGSYHDWFEGRRSWAVLMVMIDDATSRVYARFFEQETTVAAMEIFGRYAERHGLPRALYVDRDSIYRTDREVTATEALAGEKARTQFGRAMSELDVEVILAGSPQAKGRVERSNGTLQDRLVKALRHLGVNDLAGANAFLESAFLEDFNRRFMVAPARQANLHRRVPAGIDLEQVLAIHEERVVQNDWTIRWHNRWFQVTGGHRSLGLAGRRVTVCERLDGKLSVLYQGKELQWEELPEPQARPQPTADRRGPERGKKPWKPAASHPWRKGLG
jgi:transposase